MTRSRPVVLALVVGGLMVAEIQLVRAGVDPECFQAAPLVCQGSRREDAAIADRGLSPALRALGWSNECFRVMYVAGEEAGELDAFVVSMLGPPGASEEKCKTSTAGRPRRVALEAAMRAVHEYFRGLAGDSREVLRRRLEVLVVVDGQGGEIRRKLR